MDQVLADINWETVLVASILPLLGLIGIIYQSYQKRKEAREGNDATRAAKREPTWNEVVDENRKLRTDLENQKKDNDAKIEALEARFDAFEKKTNTRIGALSNMLHSASSQWPADQPGPYFSQEDLDALENTDVPYVWRNRVRPPIR